MSVVEIVDHPLIQHKISLLRDRNTGTKEFRDLVSEIAMLLCYEATRDLPTEEVEVETPVALARTKVLAGRKLALVPILRAGLGMVDGMLNLIPAAKVGHIGMYRNEETLVPVEYYCKLPNDINEREVFVLDPMLATGGSACDAIGQIKKRGAKHIKFIGLVAAPQGLKALHEAHPDVDIYVGALDDGVRADALIAADQRTTHINVVFVHAEARGQRIAEEGGIRKPACVHAAKRRQRGGGGGQRRVGVARVGALALRADGAPVQGLCRACAAAAARVGHGGHKARVGGGIGGERRVRGLRQCGTARVPAPGGTAGR